MRIDCTPVSFVISLLRSGETLLWKQNFRSEDGGETTLRVTDLVFPSGLLGKGPRPSTMSPTTSLTKERGT